MREATGSSIHSAVPSSRQRWGWSLIAVAVILVGLGLRPLAAQTCVGDCRGESKVDIGDLITGVNIALGSLPVSACPAFENALGKVDIAQIIQGVNNALNGCLGSLTPTVMGSPTNTAIPSGTVVPSNTPMPTNAVTPTSTAPPTPTATRPPGTFVDNGDGTIEDTQTGLIWEKKDQGNGLHDYSFTYVWAGQCVPGQASCQPDAAAAATCNAATGGTIGCAQCAGTATCNTLQYTTIWGWLNQLNAASFAGHSDWRIPTIGRDGGAVQLETIVDPNVPGCGKSPFPPCVAPAFNTGCTFLCTAESCSCTQASAYWSSSSVAVSPDGAWFVNFNNQFDLNEYVNDGDKASNYYVRAVRGGS